MVIHLVCAARPNFMKVAPLYRALKKEHWAHPVIVHTGQHYDLNMSDAFFEDLGLPSPHIHLGVGSGTHAEQTGQVMMAYEKALLESQPDVVIVVGDVNSTIACALTASKIVYPASGTQFYLERSVPQARRALLQRSAQKAMRSLLPASSNEQRVRSNQQRPLIAHLEAGLRSFDRSMPEEINRLVTDVLADILWTPSRDAVENLVKEGISPDKIQLVGNIMIDSLEMLREKIESQKTYLTFGLKPGGYGIVTLHRPSNVDNPTVLKKLCGVLKEIAEKVFLIFPIHPRTRRNMEENHLLATMDRSKKLFLPEPLSYVPFMNLVFSCLFVITDSGGIQEETSYLGIPCLTVRENTERPITVTHGTNQLCDLDNLKRKTEEIFHGHVRRRKKIEFWDGKTAERIVEILRNLSRYPRSHARGTLKALAVFRHSPTGLHSWSSVNF